MNNECMQYENNNKLKIILILILLVFGIILPLFIGLYIKENKTNNEISLKVGDKYELSSLINSNLDYEFKSSDESIVEVNDNGKLEAVGVGKAIITVTSNNKILYYTIYVQSKDETITNEQITLSESKIELEKGKTFTLKYEITPSNTSNEVTWNISDENVVKIENGIITALEVGSAVVTVSTSSGKSATCDVIVKDSVENIKVEAVSYIEKLAVTGNKEGLENDTSADKNIRYVGSNPNNYVTFNNETWRIIGLFDMETSTGPTEKLMKIVRNDSLGNMSWDSSASGVNNGWGINEWSQADLQTMLNGYYIGKSASCIYCNEKGQGTCSNDCSSTVTPLSSDAVNMIQNVKWNTGATTWEITADTAYSEERGTTTGKISTSGIYCNDTVERTTTWTGLVGLIYPSDYGYASTDANCRANMSGYLNYSCKNNNWLNLTSAFQWTLSPIADSDNASVVWGVVGEGSLFSHVAYVAYDVRPVVYLKSNVLITSGEGTNTNPYVLEI